MKRALFPILIIFSMVLTLSGPFQTVKASSVVPSLDVDQDGLSNTMETAGWYNLTGGPYHTNPNLADTDQDGLTDAQEKLFNTDPTNPQSPGISVTYDSSFKTLEYYSTKDPNYLAMVQGGNKFLLLQGAVIRRGTTFKINAVNTGSAVLTVSGPGSTTLTPVRDPARGGWKVTVPINAPVGLYNATITDGAWSKSMPIYVIFELPTDLTPAQVAAYLYDDDPSNLRDEVAVWWRAIDWSYYNADSTTPTTCDNTIAICSNWQYHTVTGYAQAFWTEQFTKNVLVNYTIPAINGLTDQYHAADAIGTLADASVRVNFASVKNSFSSATHIFEDFVNHPLAPYSQTGGACETSAGVYTSILRSAGIASRPFALDYNKTPGHGENGNFGEFEYDTAVMMWAQAPVASSNQWYAERTFNNAEDEYQPTKSWVSGTTGLYPLSTVGVYDPAHPGVQFKKFQDYYADAIQSANENWDFQVGSNGGGMVNTQWTGTDIPPAEFDVPNRDLKWNSKYPLQIQQSPAVDILNCQLWKGDGWAPSEWYAPADPRYLSDPTGRTATQTYNLTLFPGIPTSVGDIENWPFNPKPTSCSPSSDGTAACTTFLSAWQPVCSPLPGQTLASAQPPALGPVQPASPALNTSIQLGTILSNSGLDQNGDGRFDQLVVQFELTSSVAGNYQLGGWLLAGTKQIRADTAQVTLKAGLQTVQLTFDGQLIGDNQVNGPYQVEAIWAAPAGQAISELALPEEMTAYQTYNYLSQAYQASAFTVQPASIVGTYAYAGKTTNAKGLIETITLSVPLNVAMPGTFKVEGDLYDGSGGYVGHAQWTGSGTTAALKYAVTGTLPPYSLQHLNLLDASGKELEAFYAPVYKLSDLGGNVDQGNIALSNQSAVLSPQTISSPSSFTLTAVDSNGNGRIDQLVVSTGVDVTVAGSYWMEGLLVDDRNLPVAWSVSDPQSLSVGTNQAIHMNFDGKMLFDQLPLSGSAKFTLVAIKIFSGSLGQAKLEADVPVTGFATNAYTRAQLEPSISAASILFQDDMESGAAKWSISAKSEWSLTNNSFHIGSNAWLATGSPSTNGVLSLATPLNLTNYASPWLWFEIAYDLSGSDSVQLQVSTGGTTWTTLQTFSGSTAYWSPQLVDMSAYGKKAGVQFRFNALMHTGSTFTLDDVFVINLSAPTSYRTFMPVAKKG